MIIFLISGCGEYEVLEHQRMCQRKADSLFSVHKDSLYKKAEQDCLENYDKHYKTILDSLKKDKKRDIEKLLDI